MRERYLLGIDVGTTGTKTILFTEDGRAVAHAYRGYELSHPHVGESEQDAEEWWRAICETVREVCEGRGVADRVAAISLSTQGGTLVPTDKVGAPLRPAIVWNDARCAEEKEKFLAEVGPAETMYEKTGWKLGRALLALEIRHLKDHEPDVFAAADYFLSVPDYVSLKMTGIPALDPSNAGINQLVDIQTGRYDAALLAFAGVTEERLPRLVASGDVIGHLTPRAAEELGLSTDTVLAAGAHDQYAVALGAGALHNGDILIGSGTCWVITAIGEEFDFASNLAQSVAAVPGLRGSLMSLSSGGVCLEWLRKNVATADGTLIDFKTLDAEAANTKAAEDGLFFIPFAGRYANGRFTKASFVGLDLSHGRFHMARAVMEGVVFQILWFLEKFKTQPREEGITLAGGASKSPIWAQVLADVSGLPVRIPALADLACVGAALLAGVGGGVYESAEAGYRRFAVEERVLTPDPDRHALYAPLFERYKALANTLGATQE